jgi:hypothetical protein
MHDRQLDLLLEACLYVDGEVVEIVDIETFD